MDFLCGKDVSVLPTGFCQTFTNHCGFPQGDGAHSVLPLASKWGLKLLPTSGKENPFLFLLWMWGTVQVYYYSILHVRLGNSKTNRREKERSPKYTGNWWTHRWRIRPKGRQLTNQRATKSNPKNNLMKSYLPACHEASSVGGKDQFGT